MINAAYAASLSVASGAPALTSWNLDTKDWVILLIGGALGFALNFVWILFPDVVYQLPFLYPRHKALLEGKAVLLHHLSAQVGRATKPRSVDLSSQFRHPLDTDGIEWEVTKLSLRTRWNRDALLTCNLSWTQAGQQWEARVKGKGRYYARSDKDFDGYVYVVCECEGTSGGVTIHWKVVYELKPKLTVTDGWDGYWLMFDADDRTFAKFGRFDLKHVKKLAS